MFDNSSTDMAPAKEPKNRVNKLLNFNFINKEIIGILTDYDVDGICDADDDDD